MTKRLLLACASLALILGCSQKTGQSKIAAWEQYTNTDLRVGFRYPAGWVLDPQGNRFTAYSSNDVIERFLDPEMKGKDGSRLVIAFDKMDTLKTLDQAIEAARNTLTQSGFDISEVTPRQIQGKPGTQLHYSGFVDAKNKFEALQAIVIQDSFLCTIKFEAFNKFFQEGVQAFDTALVSVMLPESKKKLSPEDEAKPSPDFMPYDGPQVKLSYPKNFNVETPAPKAPVLFSLDVKGLRQDCNIRLDVLPAQNLALDKVIEQNAKFYKETSRGETVIDGAKAVFLNYSQVKGIQSRVYFMVKNDKIYRILFNYFGAMKADFLPAFEKTVASIALK
jgi:hypothetical protein